LSLGLSGFEMSLVVMPQVKGDPADDKALPRGRIRNTRKLLFTAAIIMSLFLVGSATVTTLLIPAQEFQSEAGAHNRALAFLAHGGRLVPEAGGEELCLWFGPVFGTLYDISTIIILCLAGTSVVTALATLLPQFLLRFGMDLRWAQKLGVLFWVFALINLS